MKVTMHTFLLKIAMFSIIIVETRQEGLFQNQKNVQLFLITFQVIHQVYIACQK